MDLKHIADPPTHRFANSLTRLKSLGGTMSPHLFYEEHGTGFPLLFGHSYLWDAAMWTPQAQALSSSYRCIVPELWGHGRSALPSASPYPIERLAEDHWALAAALGLERFVLIGLSVGGMWAVHLTLNHPEAVKALVLMDTFVGPEPEETRLRYFAMMDTVEQAGRIPPPLADLIVPLFFSPATIQRNPALVSRFREHLISLPTEQVPGILSIGRGIFSRSSVLDRLNKIQVPTLVIVGADDRSRPPHEARQMAEAIPGARLEVIEEAGHVSNLEQPERVTALLQAFLQKVLSTATA